MRIRLSKQDRQRVIDDLKLLEAVSEKQIDDLQRMGNGHDKRAD